MWAKLSWCCEQLKRGLLTLGFSVALLSVLACAGERSEYARVPLEGGEAGYYVGRWYEIEGRLGMIVSNEGGRFTALVRSDPSESGYGPTALEAVPEGLLVSVRTPTGPENYVMQRVETQSFTPPGSKACLAGSQYWICHEPPMAWIADARARERLERSVEMAGDLVDWLVGVL